MQEKKVSLLKKSAVVGAVLATFLVIAFLVTSCSSSQSVTQSTQPTSDPVIEIEDKLAIIHTNDVHGHDLATEATEEEDGTLGLASVAQLKKDYEEEGYTVLLLDAGDAVQGTNLVNLSQGETAIEFMNAVGYDAMTLGNHEFDWGADNVLSLYEKAEFPFLSANVMVDETQRPFTESNLIIELDNGAKIGVFGLTTPEVQTKVNPKSIEGLSFYAEEELYETAQKQVDGLREEGCSMIIALGHLGSIGKEAPNRSYDVLRNTEGVDLFIDGHDHEVVQAMVNGAFLVSTGAYLENIGVVLYEEGIYTEQMFNAYTYDDIDERVQNLINRENEKVEAQLSEIIGQSEVVLDGERENVRTKETNLGDFATDIMLWQAEQSSDEEIDVALTNGGNLRASIPQGDVSMKTLTTAFPYNNELTIVKLTGTELLETLEAALFNFPEAGASFPQVSGISFTIDPSVPYENGEQYPGSTYFAPASPGARVSISKVGGRDFSPYDEYTIATTSFLTDGGDTYYALARAYDANGYTTSISELDMVTRYIKDELKGVIGQEYAEPKQQISVKQAEVVVEAASTEAAAA